MKCIAIVVMLAFAAHASIIEQTGSGLLNQYSHVSSGSVVAVQQAEPVVVEARSAPVQVVEVRAAPAVQTYSAPAQVVEVRAAPAVQTYSAPVVPSKVIEIQAPVAQTYQAVHSVHSAPAPSKVVEVRVAAAAPVQHYEAAPVIVKAAPVPVVIKAAQPVPKYTAVNQGALHEAALPGYTADQTSVNLESAPGTW